jgi:hypothetical protein
MDVDHEGVDDIDCSRTLTCPLVAPFLVSSTKDHVFAAPADVELSNAPEHVSPLIGVQVIFSLS